VWLLGHHLLLLRDFKPYVTIFMNVCVITIVDVVWRSSAVTGFWALWDNIIVAMVILLKEDFNFYKL
jgi:hypothetical protein